MDSPKTKRSAIINKLRSRVDHIIMEGIREVREHGDPEILHDLAELLDNGDNESIENAAFHVLNDLKDQNAAVVLIALIEKYRGRKILNRLVCSCWQNGLDFSPHLSLFIDLAIDENYLTSIEALSVIEENIDKLDDAERHEKVGYINKHLSNVNEEKLKILEQIISIVSPVSGPFQLDQNGH